MGQRSRCRIYDVTIAAPVDAKYAAQELHTSIYHALCAMLEVAFYMN